MFIDNYTDELKASFLELYLNSAKDEIKRLLELNDSDFSKLELILKLRTKETFESLNDEEWINLASIGFPYYYVSNFGRIRRLSRLKTPVVNKYGYYKINLYHLKAVKTFTVHRLVLMAFSNIWDSNLTVNHIDRNRLNNNIKNLEWATIQEQATHRDSFEESYIKSKFRISGENNPCAGITNDIALAIYNEDKNISNRFIADKYNTPYEVVRTIRKGLSWKNITQGSTTRG